MSTNIPIGSALAQKKFGAYIYATTVKGRSWSNKMIQPVGDGSEVFDLNKNWQTDAQYPFLRVNAPGKGQGTRVTVENVNHVTGRPIMGDRKINGQYMRVSLGTTDVDINAARFAIDGGGMMTQQRTTHDLRKIATNIIKNNALKYLDQAMLCQVAGARGDQSNGMWTIPLASDAEFSDIIINPLKAPSYNRHFYGGDATSISTIDANDFLTFKSIEKVRAALMDDSNPLPAIRVDGDPMSGDGLLWVMYITSRQAYWLRNTADGKDWQTFVSQAAQRGAKHPLFTGAIGMWSGILVKELENEVIRFNQGSTVTVCTSADAYTTTTATVPTFSGSLADPSVNAKWSVDRAIIMGGSAAVMVQGVAGNGDSPVTYFEDMEDHGNVYVASARQVIGVSKLSHTDQYGVYRDHGVAVLDSYAPSTLVAS